jgi:hypothetical protein
MNPAVAMPFTVASTTYIKFEKLRCEVPEESRLPFHASLFACATVQ